MKRFMVLLRCLVVGIFLLAGLQKAASAPADTLVTASGLKYVIKKEGHGRSAKAGDKVQVHYTGRFTDSRIFDTSALDDKPIKLTVGKKSVIKGWEEILLLMQKGTELVVVIPPAMAYGSRGVRNPENVGGYMIPPDATLIFEMELVKLKD
jgi:FKBP-type peptidyl-prolyl cis-trans isomerase